MAAQEGLCKLKGLTPSRPSNGKNQMSVSIGKDVGEIEYLYKTVESRLPERTLLVIDSLDALAERNGIPCVKLICAIQKDLVEEYGANVVCILESPEQLLDYLGDGVIRIGMMEYNGRRMREIEILKLRGCEIPAAKVPLHAQGRQDAELRILVGEALRLGQALEADSGLR